MEPASMQTSPEITYKHFEPSPHVRERVEHEVARLNHFYSRITSCQVVVEKATKRRHNGDTYEVRIFASLPGGKEIKINRSPGDDGAHADVLVAIRDAFHAAQRQLEDVQRLQRGDVKAHNGPPQGRIARFLAEKDSGFIEDGDGREIYFHRNSVVDGRFDELNVGDVVRFHEELGDKGPQASSVTPAAASAPRRNIVHRGE
jgi:cold shock CspA family protein/ribosome-associated translation inhibitor RaiA